MPNFVKNRIIVGGASMLNELQEKYVVENEEKEKVFDFDKIIPMPEELKIEFSSRSLDSITYYLATLLKENTNKFNEYSNLLKNSHDVCNIPTEENCDKIINDFEKKYNSSDIDNFKTIAIMQLNNLLNYGSINWYFWAIENWGCKWNASNLEIGNNWLQFETPWDAAIPVMVEISKQNPRIKFAFLYADEDIGAKTGYMLITNGRIDYKGTFKNFSIDSVKLACNLWNLDFENEWALING